MKSLRKSNFVEKFFPNSFPSILFVFLFFIYREYLIYPVYILLFSRFPGEKKKFASKLIQSRIPLSLYYIVIDKYLSCRKTRCSKTLKHWIRRYVMWYALKKDNGCLCKEVAFGKEKSSCNKNSHLNGYAFVFGKYVSRRYCFRKKQ